MLLSGGIDSAACVRYYLDLGRTVRGLFVNYGQAAATTERESAEALARHYGIPLGQVEIKGPARFGIGEITGRNALLIFGAAMYCLERPATIALGIHAGSVYYDCSEAFMEVINALLDGYTDGRLRGEAPFLRWSKSGVWQYCRAAGVPTELTYSCEAGSRPPCGHCLSCLDRRELDVSEK